MLSIAANAEFHAQFPWVVYAYWAILGPILVWDVLLVEWWKVPSISSRIWAAEELHPTIRVAVVLLFVALGLLVISNLWAFALSMILLGHLALNE